METISGKALVECTSNEGKFFYEPYFTTPKTLVDINRTIESNGGKVVGFRYTGVKAIRVQRRDWVAGTI